MLKAQVFHIYEALEVIVIYKYKTFIFVAFSIVLLSLKHFNNG